MTSPSMTALRSSPESPSPEPRVEYADGRPLPLRTQTELDSPPRRPPTIEGLARIRRKSTYLAGDPLSLGIRSSSRRISRASSVVPEIESAWFEDLSRLDVLSPPMTPSRAFDSIHVKQRIEPPEVTLYDFTRLDYELERARVAGTGLWSTVFLADAAPKFSPASTEEPLTPPWSPPATYKHALPSLYAVKVPARTDAKEVFRQEAKILTFLARYPACQQFVVGFHGFDERNSSLVFEAVLGGSLENLNSRLKQMTEVARHLEMISIFPNLAEDLINGLAFIHDAGVVHADIKPANILLDISTPDHTPSSKPIIRARYIDFSASFRPANPSDSLKHAGGTWTYLAPEQMHLQPTLNTPTPASDIWSLGLTLLSLIIGTSPYTAACADTNNFMLREAIKTGDPLRFAGSDPVCRKRLVACQVFVDCCRCALVLDRERRITARAWRRWVEGHDLGF
ncbi:map kinase kinase pbs2 [Acrodontium crateriforme]|uniref:Map kinase kinase pbs2 n=1 Tax=Acrodontium crateriforme TaxID=150365 RepID=A0AAQ3R8B0_9PEZI|nr:map kinase kinase pbs2 [Acrodontium crateriforme]